MFNRGLVLHRMLAAISAGSILFLAGCLQGTPTGEGRSVDEDRMELSYSALTIVPHVRHDFSFLARTAYVPLDPNRTQDDWAHYGLQNAASVNRKAGVHPNSAIVLETFGTAQWKNLDVNGNPRFEWPNGTPTTSATTARGIALTQQGNRFTIKIPATGVPKQADFYVSTQAARGMMSFGLSNGTVFVKSIAMGSTSQTAVSTLKVSVTFRNFNGGTLNVDWTAEEVASGGSIMVHAVTYGNYQNTTIPTATLSNPPFPVGQNSYFQGNAFPLQVANISNDPDGIRGVQYYRNGVFIGESSTPPYGLPNYVETVGGTHNYHAVVVDQFGAAGATNTINVPIDVLIYFVNGSLPIPDNTLGGTLVTKQVSNVLGKVYRMVWVIKAKHTFVADLDFRVMAANTTMTRFLINRVGGSGDNFNNTQLSDGYGRHLSTGSAPFDGLWDPWESQSPFVGLNPNGSWRVNVRDLAAQDVGYVEKMLLVLTCRP